MPSLADRDRAWLHTRRSELLAEYARLEFPLMFFLAGTCCLLLAHASQNLGDSASAMAQIRAALTCAEEADHHGLRAWTHGSAVRTGNTTGRGAFPGGAKQSIGVRHRAYPLPRS